MCRVRNTIWSIRLWQRNRRAVQIGRRTCLSTLRTYRKDLNDLVASPSHDVVHGFLFALLFLGTLGVRRWEGLLVPRAIVLVWL